MLGLSKPVARACALFDSTDADTPPSLAEVARKVGLSSGALSKRFIAELGVNPRDWLVARKRQRFRKALREGESVADALYGAGYGSPSRVYETSDKALGMTPATYAKGGAGRAYRLHHGRFRLWPRAGGGDAEGHRRGVPGRQRPHPRERT